MPDLQGQPGELRFTLTVKRAATGKEETFEMVGRVGDAQPAPDLSVPAEKEPENGSHPLDRGA
jgi:hypothetical protein